MQINTLRLVFPLALLLIGAYFLIATQNGILPAYRIHAADNHHGNVVRSYRKDFNEQTFLGRDSILRFKGTTTLSFSDQFEFGPVFEFDADDKLKKGNIKIIYEFDYLVKGHSAEEMCVLEIKNENGENLIWRGLSINSLHRAEGQWCRVSGAIDVSWNDVKPATLQKVRCYIWNKSKSTFNLDNLEISVYQ